MKYIHLNNEVELATIPIPRGIIVSRNNRLVRTRAIQDDDLIPVFDGELVRGRFMNPTHRVIGCFGNTITQKLTIMAEDLTDQDINLIAVI